MRKVTLKASIVASSCLVIVVGLVIPAGIQQVLASSIQVLAVVAAGGTGRQSLTSGAVLYGLGTSPVGLATTPSDATQALCGTNPPAFSATCAGSSAAIDNNGVKNAIFISDTSMSANTITGTTATAFPVSYATGQQIIVKVANPVSGATTININSLGAKAVTKNGSTALVTGDLVAGGMYLMTYDGTRFVVTQNLGGAGGGTVTIGAYGSAPACAASSFIYVTTDAGLTGYCNGSSTLSWKWGPILTTPVLTGSTSWFNQGTATITQNPATVTVVSDASAGQNIQGRLMAVPATPYTQIGCFSVGIGTVQFAQAGLMWTDGTNTSTSKISTLLVAQESTAIDTFKLDNTKSTGVTGGTASYGMIQMVPSPTLCMALQDDGTTNRKFAFSYDRQNWFVLITVARTDFLTPTQVGYFVNAASSSQTVTMNLFSWETVASTLF